MNFFLIRYANETKLNVLLSYKQVFLAVSIDTLPIVEWHSVLINNVQDALKMQSALSIGLLLVIVEPVFLCQLLNCLA